jgi:hypothetical protein
MIPANGAPHDLDARDVHRSLPFAQLALAFCNCFRLCSFQRIPGRCSRWPVPNRDHSGTPAARDSRKRRSSLRPLLGPRRPLLPNHRVTRIIQRHVHPIRNRRKLEKPLQIGQPLDQPAGVPDPTNARAARLGVLAGGGRPAPRHSTTLGGTSPSIGKRKAARTPKIS